MPNQPRTPQRSIRVDDAIWSAAQVKAQAKGTTVSAEVVGFLERLGEAVTLGKGSPEHVIADAMSEHFHFCDEPRMTDCPECRRVVATAARICKALDSGGLLQSKVTTSDGSSTRAD